MRDYGKVHTSFWSSDTIRSLSEDGRMLALYLMTSPHTTITGTFRLPDGYACEDLGWTSTRVVKGFAELFANGFANRCETTKWVWIVKHLAWNPPENPNQRKAAVKMTLSIPEVCSWKAAFLSHCGAILGIESANPSATLPQPFLNQEQEQEQEQELGAAPTPSAPAVIGIPLNTGSDFPITDDQVREFSELYPAVNVLQELRAMRGWCVANPTKRKTKSGVLRFVNGWLSKEQDAPGKTLAHSGHAQSVAANGNSVAASRAL